MEDKSSLHLVVIVSIVAVVALVVMAMGSGARDQKVSSDAYINEAGDAFSRSLPKLASCQECFCVYGTTWRDMYGIETSDTCKEGETKKCNAVACND